MPSYIAISLIALLCVHGVVCSFNGAHLANTVLPGNLLPNFVQQSTISKCIDGEGTAYDCGFGTHNQNWFGPYYLGRENPYGFLSTMPYGYGSGALPFYSHPEAGGWVGTSYGSGGYFASALPIIPTFHPQAHPFIN